MRMMFADLCINPGSWVLWSKTFDMCMKNCLQCIEHYPVKEVHVVFDCPGSLAETPKELEQRRRDKAVESANHHCTAFSGDLMLPTKWRDLLARRSCKKELTEYVADEMLTLVQRSLRANQTFVANIKQ